MIEQKPIGIINGPPFRTMSKTDSISTGWTLASVSWVGCTSGVGCIMGFLRRRSVGRGR